MMYIIHFSITIILVLLLQHESLYQLKSGFVLDAGSSTYKPFEFVFFNGRFFFKLSAIAWYSILTSLKNVTHSDATTSTRSRPVSSPKEMEIKKY